MLSLPTVSLYSFYVLAALIGLQMLLLWGLQFRVLRGNVFTNPDGSKDDWHEQEIIYGIAFADVVLSCPTAIAGVALLWVSPRWGIFLLALVSFFLVWANIMTTATSLRFHRPRITLAWLVGFPFGAVTGLAYLAWVAVHFNAIARL